MRIGVRSRYIRSETRAWAVRLIAGTTAGTLAPSSTARRRAWFSTISLSSRLIHLLRIFAAARCPGPGSPGATRVFVFVSAVSVWGNQ